MDKKTLLALVFIGLILVLWPWYMRNVVGVKETTEPEEKLIEGGTHEEQDTNGIDSQEPGDTGVTGAGTPYAFQDSKDEKEEERKLGDEIILGELAIADTITVETDFIKGKISSLGGGTIVSWKLKKHFGKESEEGRKLAELIPQNKILDPDPLPMWHNLGIVFGNKAIDLSKRNFSFEEPLPLENGDTKVVFSLALEGGRVIKEFTIPNNSYTIDMNVYLESLSTSIVGSTYSIEWMRGLAPTEANTKDENPYYQAYTLQGDKPDKTKKDPKGDKLSTKWVAARTKYFLMALIPKTVEGSAAVIKGVDEINGTKIQIEYNGDQSWKLMQAQLEMPYDGTQSVTHQFQVYLGPMEYEELKGMGVGLEKMMNFGWTVIKPFSIAFYFTLQFIKGKVGNYGLAIIIFSILIKVVLYPLTRKSFQSMRKMQELQPKIAALKEKYAKEPQKLNQETMKMYKQHGVNPLGGCLPLILQMPVLFALFNLFRTTIMLRQASFIGIQDLSAPDHLLGNINVLPILMGITMMIQQKLTNKDPKQKAMAYFMPIFLTFIFFKLSAGLNLYYFMFNILTIAQELLIKKRE